MPVKKQKKEKESVKYFEAVGRRKTAVARARMEPDAKKITITVNGKDFTEYFKQKDYQDVIMSPFVKIGSLAFSVSIKTLGGGARAQAYASRHGISRALVLANPESRVALKTLGYLTRDPRKKERKKPGLKGARRAPQWSKR